MDRGQTKLDWWLVFNFCDQVGSWSRNNLRDLRLKHPSFLVAEAWEGGFISFLISLQSVWVASSYIWWLKCGKYDGVRSRLICVRWQLWHFQPCDAVGASQTIHSNYQGKPCRCDCLLSQPLLLGHSGHEIRHRGVSPHLRCLVPLCSLSCRELSPFSSSPRFNLRKALCCFLKSLLGELSLTCALFCTHLVWVELRPIQTCVQVLIPGT